MRNYKRICYLAGPMESVKDAGRGWREVYSEELKQLGFMCIIPEDKEEFITNQEELNDLKKTDRHQYVDIMRKLISLDLKFVETADIIVTRWNGEVTAGTIGEAQHAYLEGKLIYLVTDKEFHEIPGWFGACFTEIFDSLDCLLLYLSEELYGESQNEKEK